MNYDVNSVISTPAPTVQTLTDEYKVSTNAPILYFVCKYTSMDWNVWTKKNYSRLPETQSKIGPKIRFHSFIRPFRLFEVFWKRDLICYEFGFLFISNVTWYTSLKFK